MDYVIEMLNITKEFPGIKANDNVTLQVKKGEIHALLGENGAGKSTLMSVLFGLYQAEKGMIKIKGEEVKIKNPNDANYLGIGMVHQHFKLVDTFTVIENIILGVEDTKFGMLKKGHAREKVLKLIEKYNLKVDIDALVSNISVGMQQRVEILKMLYKDNEILIFDEPTAVLTPSEIDELMKIMKNLANEGKSIIFITHKLNEIKAVANKCSVLRKGKYIGTVPVKNTTKDEMSTMMVGRHVNLDIEKKKPVVKDVVLKVDNLEVKSFTSTKLAVRNVSFEVKQGEVVCLAGIEGNGQSEVIYALSGLCKYRGGHIHINGVDVKDLSIRKRNELGFAHIPEDRHKHGLVLDYSLKDNLILKKYYTKEFQKGGFLKQYKIDEFADNLIKKFDVRCGEGGNTPARAMSGGNQQKAIIAREIDYDGDLLVAVQPTRGLDVGAIEYIHNQIIAQRDAGKAVLLVSLELDEVFNLSDRILVMYEGEIVGEFNPKDITREELGLYMAGSKRQDNAKDDNKEIIDEK